ncbi:MAG: DNA primase [bacterium]|nr:DNA primase [bacterium]
MSTIDPVQDIKERLSVEALVGEYLLLKQAGVNLKGLCPFHQEKTPSFMVSPERRSWHCFGCNKGGDIFSFVMEIEGVEFREALQLLARKAGVELPTRSYDKEKSGRAQRLIEINTAAMAFYEQALLVDSGEAAAARDELARRKVDQLTREVFHIGFAPSATQASGSSWTALVEYLGKKKFSESEMVAAGVAVARRAPKQGVYDRFRNRLTFPLIDVVGRTVGFSARAMDPDEQMGKYINSPESEVYHKGKFLFSLNQAKGEIRRRDFVVLVEGQMDAVSSHRVGVTNVVATSGTALTPEQLKLLKRYTANLILAFDVDLAGSSATKRGIDLAVSLGFNVKVARMPEKVDPDDLCRERPKEWASALTKSERIVDYYIRRSSDGKDLGKVEVKKSIAQMVLPEVARLTDPVEQAHYIQQITRLVGAEESVVRAAMEKLTGTGERVGSARPTSARPASGPPADTAQAKPDSLLRKVARLIAVRVHGDMITKEALKPLDVLDAPWIAAISALVTSEQTGTALLDQVAKINADLGRLVDAEIFMLERELQDIDLPQSIEIRELIKGIAREGLRRELAKLHRQAQEVGNKQAAERFVQKTQALMRLEEV